MNTQKLILLALLSFGLAACSSQPIPDPEPTADSAGSASGDDSYDWDDTGADGSDTWGTEEGGMDAEEDELAMVVYFEFDQSDVRAEDRATLERHALRLANDASASIRLEGHADERGSREYNIGLGERRAQAVRKILLIQGAGTNQISTVSYGEERPAAFGSDEESWALNRRVEIRFIN